MTSKSICCSDFVCRPIFFFIIISFLAVCVPCLLTSLWMKDVKEINDQGRLISHKIVEGILSEIDNIDTHLAPLYVSSTHLVQFLGASVGNTTISPPVLEGKVAPILFQALLTIPHLSQISYIGFDGLVFSYHTKESQHVVLYSNDSFSSSSTSIWYTQSINEESGTPYGELVATSPSNVPNTSFFQEAFSRMNESFSVGYGWSNDEVLLVFNTLCSNRKGLVSLGFPVRLLADYLSGVIYHNGSLYLDVEHGTPIIQGIPNTHLVFSNDSITFILVNGQGEEIARVADVLCQPNGHKVNLWGTKYVVKCSQLQIFGVKLEYVLIVPTEPLESLVKKEGRFAYALLILIVISMTIFIVFFMISKLSAAKRETCLCAALIKQMEATQQAERKSMSKSLAFARASHDVRTCLAGINGLIEISREGIRSSEIGVNLTQIEECTKDLLGIVNSILDTSKIEAGKLQLREEYFDLQKLVEDVVDFHYNIGIKKGVDMILDLSDGSLPEYSCVKGDRGKLKQILDNLLNNAIKFTQEGHVIVRVWAKKPCYIENEVLVSKWNTMIKTCIPCLSVKSVRDSQMMSMAQCNPKCIEFTFEVSDTGVGIPKERQKFVFENYVQVNEARNGQEGTGLGLGIVQSLVRLIGGEIGIMDKPWGERGTCFRFNAYFSSEPKENGDNEIGSFYGCAQSELHQLSNTRVLPSVEWSSRIILFIQNDERVRIVKHFMENHGIEVFVAKDHNELYYHLRRVRGRTSGRSGSSTPRSQNSCPKSKDIPLSAMDGRTNNGTRNSSSFNLILIDTCTSALQQIHKVLKEFRREVGVMHSRVVWMKKCGTLSIQVEDLDDSSDVIVTKPLHGSRLDQILKLLPEYGGLMQSTTHDLKTSNGNTRSEASSIGCDALHTQRPMTGKRVLVAEDDRVQQLITKQVLSKLGAQVDLCQTGAQAVELVSNVLQDRAKQPYDYILMDCKMEGMDGFEASRHIREEEQKYGVHVPIIALTSHVVEDIIELIKKSQMDHYLSKPLKREQFLEAMELLNHLVR